MKLVKIWWLPLQKTLGLTEIILNASVLLARSQSEIRATESRRRVLHCSMESIGAVFTTAHHQFRLDEL